MVYGTSVGVAVLVGSAVFVGVDVFVAVLVGFSVGVLLDLIVAVGVSGGEVSVGVFSGSGVWLGGVLGVTVTIVSVASPFCGV